VKTAGTKENGRKSYKIHRRTKLFLQEKAVEATQQKEERRGKPKPEEQEGMPQHQHRLPPKRREKKNCIEDQADVRYIS
jgi:hypothetical protein